MSTFSSTTFKALNYNSFRPHYPPSFYSVLSKYIGNPGLLTRSIDLGCGTGVATYPLLNLSQEVIGLDLSPVMVSTANSLIKERCAELGVDSDRIKFKAGAVEDFLYQEPREIENGSVNLITAAQCIHWFHDYDSFFKSAAELLSPGGVLAYFFYVDPVITNYTGAGRNKKEILQKASDFYEKFVYEDPDRMGPYWEQPGRDILRKYCAETNKHIPDELYKDVKINVFEPTIAGKTVSSEDLDMKKTNIKLSVYLDYIGTASGLHSYDKATGKRAEFLEDFISAFETELGWDRKTTEIELVWNTGYTFMRKR